MYTKKKEIINHTWAQAILLRCRPLSLYVATHVALMLCCCQWWWAMRWDSVGGSKVGEGREAERL